MGLNMFINLLLMFTLNANAEDIGQFAILGEQAQVPFEGVLFDKNAIAIILTDKGIAGEACEIRVHYELEKQEVEFSLQKDNWDIRYASLQDEYKLVMEKKDLEIDQLRQSLKKHSPRNKWVWYATGIASGVVGTIIIANQVK